MIYDRGNCILIAGFTAIVGTIVYDTRSFCHVNSCFKTSFNFFVYFISLCIIYH